MRTRLYQIIAITLLLVGGISCSNDSDEIDIPREPQSNEIKMVFNATASSSEAFFYISGDDFTIDWGDGKTSTGNDVDNDLFISHTYPKNKEYVITITAHESLDYFKNFNTYESWDVYKGKVPVFENISIGADVEIQTFYLQASGVKNISMANDRGVKDASVLLDANNWNLSMVGAGYLSVYVPNKDDLDIKNLSVKSLTINVVNEIDNLSVSSCNDLLYLTIQGVGINIASVKNLVVTDLSKLNSMYLFDLRGNTATLTNLPNLLINWLDAFYYETIDMTNTIDTSIGMKLKASGISVSKSIKFSRYLTEIYIDNSQINLTNDIATLDFSDCPNLQLASIIGLASLEELKFGSGNSELNEVVLKILPKLKALDFSLCENIKKVETKYVTSLETVLFSSKNQVLRNIIFQYNNFSEASCIEMINSLPNFAIPNIPSVNRRLFSMRGNAINLNDNDKVTEAARNLRSYWSFVFE